MATYIEEMHGRYRAPTIKQHLAAIRRLFDWLVIGQVVPTNPATSVRGPTHVVKTGKTPVLPARRSAAATGRYRHVDSPRPARSRAAGSDGLQLCARLGRQSACALRTTTSRASAGGCGSRKKGGKHHALPVHHKAEAYLDAYLAAAGIAAEKDAPLWRSMPRAGRDGRAPDEPGGCVPDDSSGASQTVGLGEANCHTFRATGITAYLLNGGTLERAQAIGRA